MLPSIPDAISATTPMTIQYLRRLVNVPEHWDIRVVWGDLPASVSTALCVVGDVAVIQLNPLWHFSRQALLRSIAHEMLELVDYATWVVFTEMLGYIPSDAHRIKVESKMRSARDQAIDTRLNAMPFWSAHDIPSPKVPVDVYYA
jgi:hypothetical protein